MSFQVKGKRVKSENGCTNLTSKTMQTKVCSLLLPLRRGGTDKENKIFPFPTVRKEQIIKPTVIMHKLFFNLIRRKTIN